MIEQMCFNQVLLESAQEIFETMVFMSLTETAEPEDTAEGWTLLGSITFKGDIEGCLAIICKVPCAQTIAANMLGMDSIEELTEEDTCDAIGEISNMVMGCVKKRLMDSGLSSLEVSVPSVFSGRELKNNLGDGAKKISVKVNLEEKYMIELTLLYREKGN